MFNVLFICRGNTCRSALAEAIARKLLADTPIPVASAGLQAYDGMTATPEAIAAAAAMGIDLRRHRARQATEDLVRRATVIYPMTSERTRHFEHLFPAHAAKAQRLDPDGNDIPDPIGRGLLAYMAVAAALERAIGLRTPEWLRLAVTTS